MQLAQFSGEAIDVEAHPGDAIAEEPMSLIQLFIVLILHGFRPVDEGPGDDSEQPGEAFAGFRMSPVDFVIESLYGGAVGDKAGVEENAGIAIREILLLYGTG